MGKRESVWVGVGKVRINVLSQKGGLLTLFLSHSSTPEAVPPSVRCVNSAIPYVVSAKIPRSKFITKFTQKEPAIVAADMLTRGAGETIVSVWLHWEAVSQLNYMGLPTTGWNGENLDK